MKHWDQQKRKRAVALTCLGAAVLMMVAIFWFVGRPLIAFVSQPERFRAWVDNGILSFETAQEKDVLVYTLNGVLVGTYPNSKGIRRTDLKPGAYLVVCGDKAIKIVM